MERVIQVRNLNDLTIAEAQALLVYALILRSREVSIGVEHGLNQV
jgi:hypothetical protein